MKYREIGDYYKMERDDWGALSDKIMKITHLTPTGIFTDVEVYIKNTKYFDLDFTQYDYTYIDLAPYVTAVTDKVTIKVYQGGAPHSILREELTTGTNIVGLSVPIYRGVLPQCGTLMYDGCRILPPARQEMQSQILSAMNIMWGYIDKTPRNFVLRMKEGNNIINFNTSYSRQYTNITWIISTITAANLLRESLALTQIYDVDNDVVVWEGRIFQQSPTPLQNEPRLVQVLGVLNDQTQLNCSMAIDNIGIDHDIAKVTDEYMFGYPDRPCDNVTNVETRLSIYNLNAYEVWFWSWYFGAATRITTDRSLTGAAEFVLDYYEIDDVITTQPTQGSDGKVTIVLKFNN